MRQARGLLLRGSADTGISPALVFWIEIPLTVSCGNAVDAVALKMAHQRSSSPDTR